MDLKTAIAVILIAIAWCKAANADEYDISFPTSDADHTESVLIVCNVTKNVCTKEIYKNKELSDKTYDRSKSPNSLDRLDHGR